MNIQNIIKEASAILNEIHNYLTFLWWIRKTCPEIAQDLCTKSKRPTYKTCQYFRSTNKIKRNCN